LGSISPSAEPVEITDCNQMMHVGSISLTSPGIKIGKKKKKELQYRRGIAKFALKFRGKRYGYGSNGPNKFDCSGFTNFVFHHYNVRLDRSSKLQSKQGKIKKIGLVEPADLVFFGTGSKVNHVGIVVEASKGRLIVIHSTSSKGVIVEDIFQSDYWSSRLLFAKEVIKL